MRVLLALLLCATTAFSQDERRVVELKHISATDLGGVLEKIVRVDADASRKLVVLIGPGENVAVAESIIKKLDQPRQTIELTFYILATAGGSEGKLPRELEPVVKQLEKNFTFSDYRLLDSAFVRAREGSGFEVTGAVGSGEYSIVSHRPLTLQQSNGATRVQSESLTFALRQPTKTLAQIAAPLDIREGQKIVIGKSASPSTSGAVFLVVTASVVD